MAGSSRDTLRPSKIPEAERQAMLDRLDAAEEQNPAKNKRHMPRIQYRKSQIALRVHHPGGSTSASFVTTRNLSAGGISLLYQGFLYKDTKVEIVLSRRLGGDDVVRGVVQHCALVNRTLHLIGVRFEQQIFPKLYLDPSEWGELDDATPVDRASLRGTVLHLDDQELDRMLMAHFLKGTKIDLVSVDSVESAITQMKSRAIDCVLCDLIMQSVPGEAAIRQFRSTGYVGPIAIVSAETSPTRIRSAMEAGAATMLAKPFDSAKLMSLLATWLNGTTAGEDPIYSTLANQETMAGMIGQYVQKLKTLGRDLHKHLEGGNVDGLRQVCQMIKGTGAGFGFTILSELARDAVHCLDTSNSAKDSASQIHQLESACNRAAAPPFKAA